MLSVSSDQQKFSCADSSKNSSFHSGNVVISSWCHFVILNQSINIYNVSVQITQIIIIIDIWTFVTASWIVLFTFKTCWKRVCCVSSFFFILRSMIASESLLWDCFENLLELNLSEWLWKHVQELIIDYVVFWCTEIMLIR